MKFLFYRFLSPESKFGKSIRDAIWFALGAGLIALLQQIQTIDFGDYQQLVSTLAGFGLAFLNRQFRPVKREDK